MTAPREPRPQQAGRPHELDHDGDAVWPPNPRTVLLFCLAVMSIAVPWCWWALS